MAAFPDLDTGRRISGVRRPGSAGSGPAVLCQREMGYSAAPPSSCWVFIRCLTFSLKIKAQLPVTLHHERDQKTLSQRHSFLGLQAAVSEKQKIAISEAMFS